MSGGVALRQDDDAFRLNAVSSPARIGKCFALLKVQDEHLSHPCKA
jgi:hypothetical protein